MESRKENGRKENILLLLIALVILTGLVITSYITVVKSKECTLDLAEQAVRLMFVIVLSMLLGGIIMYAFRSKERVAAEYI
jgi:hypothetical protein